MTSIKKKIISAAATGSIFLPALAFAQEEAGSESFVNSVSLWVAIAVGIIASLMVLRGASKIGGGVLGTVYKYIGVGMLVVVLGFVAVVVPAWASEFVVGRTHDVLFIVGYLIMALGAQKMLTAGKV